MGIVEYYNYVWYEAADPRTKDWALIGSPWPLTFIIFSYLYFVLRCGPRFMKNRKPYSLKTFIRCYNVFQVLFNGFIIYRGILNWRRGRMPLTCFPSDYTYEPWSYNMAGLMWWNMMLKLTDFTETAVFVLRKKDRQISFLHLYHHVSSLLVNYMVLKWLATGMGSFFVLLNSCVHVIMYSYYLLSTCGPRVQALIRPVKPYITTVQMVQFVIMILYNVQIFEPSCQVPRAPSIIMMANLFMNFHLFYDFYKKSYVKTKLK